jgi:hypothetical protein
MGRLRIILTLFCLSFIRKVTSDTNLAFSSDICSANLGQANATGSSGFASNAFAIGLKSSYGNVTWSVAVGRTNLSSDPYYANIYVGTPAGLDFDDGSNPFSGCAMVFSHIPENTVRRAQNDDGSCHQAFSEGCVHALTEKAANIAQGLTSTFTPGPFSNLTPPVLDSICGLIATGLGQGHVKGNEFPSECQPFFSGGGSLYPYLNTIGELFRHVIIFKSQLF